ncbi:MAG: HAMP domain-containing histidine kinase [Eubacterium sp.]|nr:HAMP domain-containing histidine kinase [Eubacterium sp.]
MKRLKLQVFLLVFIILSVITTAVFGTYNAQLYNRNKKNVERSLNRTTVMGIGDFDIIMDSRGAKDPDFDGLGDIRFMDSVIYTVVLNSDNSVRAVIDHSGYSYDEEKIESFCATVVSNGSSQRIGNLYTERYSYKYVPQSYITIVDNSAANEELKQTLLYSVLLYVLLEILFALISNIITKRITEPVAQSFEKQKQFIADASHELKTPLSVIMASADALEINPSERKWLDNIKSESERMNKLITALLDLAKSESVEENGQRTVSSLSKLVEKSVLAFEGVMFEKGVLLKDDIQDGIMLNMNEMRLQQLVSILLDNAVKHSEKGGTVEVTLKKDKDIILSVINEGEGIPKGEEARIFERFYRADESRNRNENRYGLGLAIAKNICQSHNAQISAKSENGKTTFTVIFNI